MKSITMHSIWTKKGKISPGVHNNPCPGNDAMNAGAHVLECQKQSKLSYRKLEVPLGHERRHFSHSNSDRKNVFSSTGLETCQGQHGQNCIVLFVIFMTLF